MMKPYRYSLALLLSVPLLAPVGLAAEGSAESSADGRRLEVLFFGAPTENHAGHDPITRYRALKKGLGKDGINLSYTEDPSEALNSETLDDYDALLMYANWELHGEMPENQLNALLGYVEDGGGFLPIHCASACYGGTEEFIDLVGARFASHGGAEFEVTNVKPEHPILQNLEGFKAWDETYVHDQHNDDRTILQKREDEPWTWVRNQGDGRVFYTAAGHDHRVWDLEPYQNLLRNAIYWAVGSEAYALLQKLNPPEPGMIDVMLPGYRENEAITRIQEPLSPDESLKLSQVPVDMELSLFASDPDIVNPIHVAWDDQGRAFVIETIDYPNNLQEDNLGNDRITICEDTDDDGKADQFTRFAENLSIPTSMTFANGGVVCTNGSEMLFLKDTDGDDKADVRKVLFKGFGMGDTHAGVSNLRYHNDGWLYATVGYSGFDGTVGDERIGFYQAVFRFDIGQVGLDDSLEAGADGTLQEQCRLEVIQNTTNNTWGLGFTEGFDVLGSTANANPSWYVTFPRKAYASVGLEQPRTPGADDNPLFFPMSMDIRQVDQFDRYTSAAGHAFYNADRFPEKYRNRIAFVCGPTGKLVSNFELTRKGAGWVADQSPNNLYDSADVWSAPVAAEVGPDGAVWICDWYNVVVQHNPTPTKNATGMDAETGRGNAYVTPHRDKQHGRIYRVFPKGSSDDSQPDLKADNVEGLVAALKHPNQFWRLHAQRLLAEKGDQSVISSLESLVQEGGVAAPHALSLISQLGTPNTELIRSALKADFGPTRRVAREVASPADLKAVFYVDGTLQTDSPEELAEVLVGLSAGASDPEIGAAIYQIALEDYETISTDDRLADAWRIAARRQVDGVLAAAGEQPVEENTSEPKNVLPNADFSEASDGMPASWTDIRTYGGADGSQVTVESASGGRNGGKCLKIASENPTDTGVAVVVPVEPGYNYQLSGWIKTENVDPVGNAPGALMNVHGGGRTEGVSGDSDWTPVAMDFRTTSNQNEILIHCLFGGYGGASGTAYFDDVKLVKAQGGNSLAGAITVLENYQVEGDKETPEIVRDYEPDVEVHERGKAVFARTCVACHGVDGEGVPGAFPPLAGSDWVTGSADVPIRIVLGGLTGAIEVNGEPYESVMPPHTNLDDQEISDVLTYVRQTWTNDAAPVSVEQVATQREETSDRSMPWTASELGR